MLAEKQREHERVEPNSINVDANERWIPVRTVQRLEYFVYVFGKRRLGSFGANWDWLLI
jgi:hypothetical protein